VQLNAMLLKPGAYTIVEMELSGKNGTTIPRGARISSGDGLYTVSTMEPVFIGDSGVTTVQAQFSEKGPFEPGLGTIITIRTPQSGWLKAKNTATLAVGDLQETEEEARRRQQRSTSLTSYRQIEAIYAAVMNVPGVIYCRAYQNDKVNPVDTRGIPFKEVAVVAEGGDPRAIGEALFLRFPVGVVGYGNTFEAFYDQQGVSYAISFSRPIDVLIAVEVDVEITNRANFPDTGGQLIAEAIVNYAKYGGEGNEDGFPPGADIINSRLYTPVNSVAGHKVTRLVTAVVPNSGKPAFSTATIPIAWDHVGRFDVSRITVNVSSPAASGKTPSAPE